MAQFLADTLNEAFGRSRPAKSQPTTQMIAMFEGDERVIAKDGKGLYRVHIAARDWSNSRLGDLVEQLERNGIAAERRAL